MEFEEAVEVAREVVDFGPPLVLDGLFFDSASGAYVVEACEGAGALVRVHNREEWATALRRLQGRYANRADETGA